MVGTARFELASSPTPFVGFTRSEQLSAIGQYVRQRETTRRNAYWTRNGPTIGPTLVYAIKNAARTATSEGGGKHSLQSLMMAPLKISHPLSTRDHVLAKDCWSRGTSSSYWL